MPPKAQTHENISGRKGNLLLLKMPEIKELIQRKKKLKKKKGDEWEFDANSDYPLHERYAKEEAWKEG